MALFFCADQHSCHSAGLLFRQNSVARRRFQADFTAVQLSPSLGIGIIRILQAESPVKAGKTVGPLSRLACRIGKGNPGRARPRRSIQQAVHPGRPVQRFQVILNERMAALSVRRRRIILHAQTSFSGVAIPGLRSHRHGPRARAKLPPVSVDKFAEKI